MFAPTDETVALILAIATLVSWGTWIPARHKCHTDLYGWVMLAVPTRLATAIIYAFTLGQISSDAPGFDNETFINLASDSFSTWRALIILGGGFFSGIGTMCTAAGKVHPAQDLNESHSYSVLPAISHLPTSLTAPIFGKFGNAMATIICYEGTISLDHHRALVSTMPSYLMRTTLRCFSQPYYVHWLR